MGGSQTARKQPGQRFFFFFFQSSTYFTVYRVGPMVLLQRKLYFSKDRGGPTFQGGGSRVQGINFYRNPYYMIFRGWGGPHRWNITLPHYICKLPGRVKSGKYGHYLQIVLIQMRRLLTSRHIRSFTICLGNLFLFQYLKYETNKVAVRN